MDATEGSTVEQLRATQRQQFGGWGAARPSPPSPLQPPPTGTTSMPLSESIATGDNSQKESPGEKGVTAAMEAPEPIMSPSPAASAATTIATISGSDNSTTQEAATAAAAPTFAFPPPLFSAAILRGATSHSFQGQQQQNAASTSPNAATAPPPPMTPTTQKLAANLAAQLHACPFEGCGKSFVWRNSLTQHIHLHHRAVKDEFVCDACQSVLSSMTKLRRHQREHCPFRDDCAENRAVPVRFVKLTETVAKLSMYKVVEGSSGNQMAVDASAVPAVGDNVVRVATVENGQAIATPEAPAVSHDTEKWRTGARARRSQQRRSASASTSANASPALGPRGEGGVAPSALGGLPPCTLGGVLVGCHSPPTAPVAAPATPEGDREKKKAGAFSESEASISSGGEEVAGDGRSGGRRRKRVRCADGTEVPSLPGPIAALMPTAIGTGGGYRLKGKGKRRRDVGIDRDERLRRQRRRNAEGWGDAFLLDSGEEEDELDEEEEEEDEDAQSADSSAVSDGSDGGEGDFEFQYSSDEDLGTDNNGKGGGAITAPTLTRNEKNRKRHQRAKERRKRNVEMRKMAKEAKRAAKRAREEAEGVMVREDKNGGVIESAEAEAARRRLENQKGIAALLSSHGSSLTAATKPLSTEDDYDDTRSVRSAASAASSAATAASWWTAAHSQRSRFTTTRTSATAAAAAALGVADGQNPPTLSPTDIAISSNNKEFTNSAPLKDSISALLDFHIGASAGAVASTVQLRVGPCGQSVVASPVVATSAEGSSVQQPTTDVVDKQRSASSPSSTSPTEAAAVVRRSLSAQSSSVAATEASTALHVAETAAARESSVTVGSGWQPTAEADGGTAGSQQSDVEHMMASPTASMSLSASRSVMTMIECHVTPTEVESATLARHLRSPASFTIRQFPNNNGNAAAVAAMGRNRKRTYGERAPKHSATFSASSTTAGSMETNTQQQRGEDGGEEESFDNDDEFEGDEPDDDEASSAAKEEGRIHREAHSLMYGEFHCPFSELSPSFVHTTAKGGDTAGSKSCRARPFAQRRHLLAHMRRSHPEVFATSDGNAGGVSAADKANAAEAVTAPPPIAKIDVELAAAEGDDLLLVQPPMPTTLPRPLNTTNRWPRFLWNPRCGSLFSNVF